MQVHTYTSNAQFPLKDVAITITDSNEDAVAMRLTDRSGLLPEPVRILTPNMQDSQQPTSGPKPYTSINLFARLPGYEEVYSKNIQIFPNTVTLQNIELIPLSEFPEAWNKGEAFDTPGQNL